MSVMLSQAVSLGELNLYDLIFKTILKLPQCTGGAEWGCVNGVFAHDFIYGLFLPHIVILIFIFGASQFGQHKGLSTLLGVGIYTFIVYAGWFPFFASLTIFWLIISIGISAFFFVSGKIIAPSKAETLGKLVDKAKQKRMLREEIRRLEALLRRTPADQERERAALQEALANAQDKLRQYR